MLARIDELEIVVQARRDVLDDRALRDQLTEIERQFGTHMTAEDDALVPAMDAAFPEARGTLAPLRAEHAELRVLTAADVRELERRLGALPKRGQEAPPRAGDEPGGA